MNLPKTNINSTTPSHQRHAVFRSFLSDDSKQDDDTTTAHSKKHFIAQREKVMTTSLSIMTLR